VNEVKLTAAWCACCVQAGTIYITTTITTALIAITQQQQQQHQHQVDGLLAQWRARAPIDVSDALKLLGRERAFQTEVTVCNANFRYCPNKWHTVIVSVHVLVSLYSLPDGNSW
jgi:hypothetical protein